MNQEVSSPVPTWCKAVIVVLLALCIVLICQAYRATATANDLENSVTDICAGSMQDIELELRSNNPNLGKNLYQFYTSPGSTPPPPMPPWRSIDGAGGSR